MADEPESLKWKEERFLGSEKREKKKKVERQGGIEEIVEGEKKEGGEGENWKDLEVRMKSCWKKKRKGGRREKEM